MIRFDFDWSDLLNQTLLALAMLMLGMQAYWLFLRNSFGRRPALRGALNIMLWLSVLSFLLKPYWFENKQTKTILLVADHVPGTFADHIADSLNVTERIDPEDLANVSADTLLLAGQGFSPDLKSAISNLNAVPTLRWIPFFSAGEIQALRWKGILRKGQMQVVRGNVQAGADGFVKLKYGGHTLDSVFIKTGYQDFKLQFPVFAQGRNVVELWVGEEARDTIHFFARPSAPLSVKFLLNSPDFESRNLATWLGKNGYPVQYGATLSRDLKANVNINNAKEPDLIVTDATNSKNTEIKKALAGGKGVLFINLTNPASELPIINAAMHTNFAVRRISNEAFVPLSLGLNALPYNFVMKNNQERAPDYPVVTENTAGKVSVSLLTETFPIQLSGDSATYERIWNAILAVSTPTPKNNIEIEFPVRKDKPALVQMNGFEEIPEQVGWGQDTVFMRSSLINALSAAGQFVPQKPGWMNFSDSMEIYVDKSTAVSEMSAFVGNYQNYHSQLHKQSSNAQFAGTLKKFPPDWFWYALFLFCFAGLWVEEKF